MLFVLCSSFALLLHARLAYAALAPLPSLPPGRTWQLTSDGSGSLSTTRPLVTPSLISDVYRRPTGRARRIADPLVHICSRNDGHGGHRPDQLPDTPPMHHCPGMRLLLLERTLTSCMPMSYLTRLGQAPSPDPLRARWPSPSPRPCTFKPYSCTTLKPRPSPCTPSAQWQWPR